MRPTTDEWFLGIAQAVAAMADCTRSKVGAVIATGKELIQPGYNGAPPGKPGCLTDGACPRGRHYKSYAGHADGRGIIDYCACDKPWPCPDAVEAMSSYDTGPGACIAVHAELNAIMRAGRDRCAGATMYVTREPCDGCWRVIDGAGIVRVVWPGGARCLA